MQISKLNITPLLNFKGKFDLKPNFSNFCTPLEQDVFEKRPDTNSRINENSRQRVPFGVNRDYIKCPKEKLDKIFEQIPPEIKRAAEESVFAGCKTKELFDKQYGENNYVIVSLGTSPAGIAKSMEYMGVDVRYVPISNLDHILTETFENTFKKQENSSKYRDFLNSIGLNKEQIESDKRKYIVIDYTASGDSLMVASDIAKYYLGINNKNVTFKSINDTLLENSKMESNIADSTRIEVYIDNYLETSKIGEMCGIPHVHVKNLGSIDKCIKENKPDKARQFELALCHYILSADT